MRYNYFDFAGPSLNWAHTCVADGDAENVRHLVRSGRVRPEQLVCFAAMCGQVDVLETLLELGASPDAKSRAGIPALVYAASATEGAVECISALLRAGASKRGMVVGDRIFQKYDAKNCWDAIPATGTIKVLVYKLCGRIL